MSLFPFIGTESTEIENKNENLPLYREVAWDFKENKPIIENGDFKIVEENEAIKVWIYKALLTQRYQHQIYSWDYGSELIELVGRGYSPSLTKEEAKRYVKEALIVNPYIIDVTVDDVLFSDSLLEIKLKVETIYGESEVNLNV